MERYLLHACALVALSTCMATAQTVDFETIPGQGTPVENQLISDEFEEDYGVTFYLLESDGTLADPSIGPRIAGVGGEKTAFVGPEGDTDCDAIGTTTNDTVLDFERSGCWLLTDDGEHPGPRPFGLLIEYSTPVLQAGGELVDVDGGPEAWEITALDSLGMPIVHPTNPIEIEYAAYPGADDGDFALFAFDLGQPIHAITLVYTGEASFGRGLAFDNFTPASLPTAVPESSEERSWGRVKADFRSSGGGRPN